MHPQTPVTMIVSPPTTSEEEMDLSSPTTPETASSSQTSGSSGRSPSLTGDGIPSSRYDAEGRPLTLTGRPMKLKKDGTFRKIAKEYKKRSPKEGSPINHGANDSIGPEQEEGSNSPLVTEAELPTASAAQPVRALQATRAPRRTRRRQPASVSQRIRAAQRTQRRQTPSAPRTTIAAAQATHASGSPPPPPPPPPLPLPRPVTPPDESESDPGASGRLAPPTRPANSGAWLNSPPHVVVQFVGKPVPFPHYWRTFAGSPILEVIIQRFIRNVRQYRSELVGYPPPPIAMRYLTLEQCGRVLDSMKEYFNHWTGGITTEESIPTSWSGVDHVPTYLLPNPNNEQGPLGQNPAVGHSHPNLPHNGTIDPRILDRSECHSYPYQRLQIPHNFLDNNRYPSGNDSISMGQ